jgi:uncharacterized NAD(P)/FAD-binding protein YdhS
MPPANAERICRVLRSGQLEVLPGLKSICRLSSGGFSIKTIPREGAARAIKANAVINATGQGTDIRKFDQKLIRSLLSAGSIAPHPNGGMNVDLPTGRIIDEKGKISDSLFALGELTKGVHFYTNGIDPCAYRARNIVTFILGDTRTAAIPPG